MYAFRKCCVFWQKIIDMGDESWYFVRKYIIKKYRISKRSAAVTLDPEDDPSFPSPEEFLRFVLSNLEGFAGTQPDNHWKRQWRLCPVCQLRFDVVAKYEDMAPDAMYFLSEIKMLTMVISLSNLTLVH